MAWAGVVVASVMFCVWGGMLLLYTYGGVRR